MYGSIIMTALKRGEGEPDSLSVYSKGEGGPVQPSFGRPIFSLDVMDVGLYRQIPTNCIMGGPQTSSWSKNK